MNQLILNRETFQMPADGWYQIAPVGEFKHSGAGVVQVVDKDACDAMVNAFRQESQNANFAGLLIDFDHFSLDEKLKSEAAGWITALEFRGGEKLTAEVTEYTENNAGLWAQIRWSDLGEDCVKGGRYRFISPVWSRSDCVSVGTDEASGQEKLRPVRLLNAAVTNDPNLKGMRPLSNRRSDDGDQRTDADGLRESGTTERRRVMEYQTRAAPENTEGKLMGSGDASHSDALQFRETRTALPNSETTAVGKRLEWVLGENDRNCPSCAALAGQVHSAADWDAAGLRPGAEKLYCSENCHCKLVETEAPARGSFSDLPIRKETAVNRRTENRGRKSDADGLRERGTAEGTEYTERDAGGLRDASQSVALQGDDVEVDLMIVNKWSDAARAASIAVRKAKAAARRKAEKAERAERKRSEKRRRAEEEPLRREILPVDGIDDEYRVLPVLDDDYDFLPVEDDDNGFSPIEEGEYEFLIPDEDSPQYEDFQRTREAMDDYQEKARQAFREEYGADPVEPEEIAWAEEAAQIPEEYRTGGEMTTEELAARLTAQPDMTRSPGADSFYSEHQRLEGAAEREARKERNERQQDERDIHAMAEGLMERESGGDALSEQEEMFLKRYREIIGDLDAVRRDVMGNRACADVAAVRVSILEAKQRARDFRGRMTDV